MAGAGVGALAPGPYAMELAPNIKPGPFLAELSSRGATVESLHPVRDTLEDFFLRQVKNAETRQEAGL